MVFLNTFYVIKAIKIVPIQTMTMNLYKLFSCNVEIQYKGCLLSKAMLFTVVTTAFNIVLPFIVAYRSRGFWLRSYSFYEQPRVHFTYEYLLVAETEDPSRPIVCGEGAVLDEEMLSGEENCADIQVQEYDNNKDGINDFIDFKVHLVVPNDYTISSVLLVLALDYQLKSVCPLHMQSLAVITKEFSIPPSGFRYFGDLHFNQITHLPCDWNVVDTKYNNSMFSVLEEGSTFTYVVDSILERYFRRDVTTQTKSAFSRSLNGHTGTADLKFSLRLPEVEIVYTPSVMQEFKWAWPQYLSVVVVFYWIIERIKRFVFRKRLLMAWEVVPWKK